MDVFMEKGLCLERTKVGSDDKQHAYAVSRRQGACIAGSIFIAFLVCAAAIIEFKAEMLTSAVQDRRMERIKEMAVREEHRPEAKLMRVSTRLEAHLMRDQQHRAHLKLYRERQQMVFDQYTQKIKGMTSAGSPDAEAIVKETHHFHTALRSIAETHTDTLHKEGSTVRGVESGAEGNRRHDTGVGTELECGGVEQKTLPAQERGHGGGGNGPQQPNHIPETHAIHAQPGGGERAEYGENL